MRPTASTGAAAWLRALTRVTRAAAGAATGWARRLAAHPVIAGRAGRRAGPGLAGPADLRRGPTSSPKSSGPTRTGSCWPPFWAARISMIWPGWPGRCSNAPAPARAPATTGSRSGRCGWAATFGDAGRLQGDLTPGLRRGAERGAGRPRAEGRAGRYPHPGPAPARRDRGGLPAADRGADDPRPGRPAPAPDRARGPARPARPLAAGTRLDPGDDRGRARIGVPDRPRRRGGRL